MIGGNNFRRGFYHCTCARSAGNYRYELCFSMPIQAKSLLHLVLCTVRKITGPGSEHP